MKDAGRGDTKSGRGRGPMSEERRERVRMEISLEAAHLFWEQGVADTTGDQIAKAVGLSVSTIWRYFRNKESCVEPIMVQNVEWFLSVLRRWPRESSFEDHYTAELTKVSGEQDANELVARRMIVLAEKEPVLRAAWLMACDRAERQLVVVIADRLGRPTDDVEVRTHAAAAAAVLRVLTEDISVAVLAGSDLADLGTPLERAVRVVRALRVATGGVLGDPVGATRGSRESREKT